MIDPTFRNINELFVHSLKTGENDPTRNSKKLVEIKDFNANWQLFFDQPVKKKQQEVYKKTCWNVKNW